MKAITFFRRDNMHMYILYRARLFQSKKEIFLGVQTLVCRKGCCGESTVDHFCFLLQEAEIQSYPFMLN